MSCRLFARIAPNGLRESLPSALALICAALACNSPAQAGDITWAPGGDPLQAATWAETDGNWLDSSGQVNWDQTQTGVFAGVTQVYPIYNAPIQAGLRVDNAAAAAPAIGYTGGAAPSALSNSQNLQWYAGLDPVSGTTAPTYTLGLVGTPSLNTGTNGNLTTVVTTLMQGTGGFTKTGSGLLTLRNPFSTFEGNIVISQGLLNTQSSPPQTTTFGSTTAYDYFNQLNAYSGTGSLASQPQPSTFGRADIPRTVTISSGASLYLQGVDAFGGSAGPAPQITLNIESGARLWTDFIGGYSSSFGGIDPARPSGGQRGPVTSMGAINLNSGSMNGSWSWFGPSGTATQLQPISTGSQAWLLRGTVTSSGSSIMDSLVLSRGYHAGMHLYDTPFVVTGGTLNVPGQFFNPASATTNTPSGLSKSGSGTMVISGNNWHSGTTSVVAGTLRSDGRKNPLKLSPVAVTGSTGILEIASSQSVPSLDVSKGEAKLPATPYVVLTTNTLSVNEASGGGRLDVGSGKVNFTSGMTDAQLQAKLAAGRGSGGWDGSTGITSSVAAASFGDRAVGWVDNGDGTRSIAFSAPGDTNIDGYVDVNDASNFAAAGKYGTGQPAVWSEGDFNYDGVVDVLDASDFATTGLYGGPNYLTAPAEATPPVKTEQFTTNPNWTYFQTSGTQPQQGYATWTGTSPIGTGGAVGGSMYVSGQSNNRIGTYFADTTTFSGSNALNYSDTFFAKGNIYMSNANFNGGLGVGFFNWEQVNGRAADGTVGVSGTTQGSVATQFIGVQMAEPNSPAVTGPFRTWLYQGNTNRETAEYSYSYSAQESSSRTATSGTGMVQGSIVPFAFQWVGGTNGSGMLTGTLNGQNLSLTLPTRPYFGAYQLDAFGIVTGLGGSSINPTLTTNIWLDDLVYGYGTLASAPSLSSSGIAAVPEPAAWQAIAAALGMSGLWTLSRRRRT